MLALHIVFTGLYSELTHPEVIISKFLECQRNFEKGFQLKIREKRLFLEAKSEIRVWLSFFGTSMKANIC